MCPRLPAALIAASLVAVGGCGSSNGSQQAGQRPWSALTDEATGIAFSLPYPVDPLPLSGPAGTGRSYFAEGGPDGMVVGIAVIDDQTLPTRDWAAASSETLAGVQPSGGIISMTPSEVEHHPIGDLDAYDVWVMAQSAPDLASAGSRNPFRFTFVQCGHHGLALEAGGAGDKLTQAEVEDTHEQLRESVDCGTASFDSD